MIKELRAVVDLIAKHPEDVQRIAAAALSALLTQCEVKSDLLARLSRRAPR